MTSAPAKKSPEAEISVLRAGSQPSTTGAEEHFTGKVQVESRFQRTNPARIGGAIVSFEPSARTAWHTHPLGQTLIVTRGVGLIQAWGSAVQEIKPGDVVWIPPDVKHWHGASPADGMTHIAISEALNSKTVIWSDHVSEEEYCQN